MTDPNIMRQSARDLYRAAKEREAWEKMVTRQYRLDWQMSMKGRFALEPTFKRDTSRDETIRRMLQDEHETLEQVGQYFSLTRERIRQIAAKAGIVWDGHFSIVRPRAEKHRAHIAAVREAKRQASADHLATARALVEGGMSIRKAAKATGWKYNTLLRHTKGWPTRYGRWRPELPALRAKAVEMYTADQKIAAVAVARALNMSAPFVYTALAMAGVPGRRRTRKPRIAVYRKEAYRKAAVRLPAEHRPISFAIRPSSNWPANTLSSLVGLWNEGKSAAQIGAIIGKSREAVLGKLFRARNKSVTA